jgi:hypothetical protein
MKNLFILRSSGSRRLVLPGLLLMALLAVCLNAEAQAPQQFSFQGVARDAAGKIVTNAEIGYSFNLHEGTAGGIVVFTKEGSTTTNSNGIFNITIGTSASPLPASIEWGAKSYFLQVGVDSDGAINGYTFTDIGTTQLLSVPYALYSNEAGKWRNNEPVLQKGTLGQGAALPSVGFGSRLIWHPNKAAFRAGYAINNDWEEGNIGAYSFAAGNGPKATGPSSASIGNSSQALAENAVALGHNATATAANSMSMGENTAANGTNSVSIGQGTIAGGNNSLAIGLNAIANGSNSFALGNNTTANQNSSMAIGNNAYAPGIGAISIGYYTTASAAYSIAMGRFNNNVDVPNGSGSDRLFQIGNGSGINQRSNALTILKNGNVGIGPTATVPAYILDVDGRMRIKHNGNSSAGMWLGSADGNSDNSIFIGAQGDNGAAAGFFFPGTGWTFWVGGGGNGHFNQQVYAQEFIENSDRELKTNFKILNNSLHNLHSISGYNYNWKKGDTRTHVGVIAQEVEKYFPELVYTKEDGFKAVRYTGLIPHLIEAVKELDKRTEELTALKKELAEVKEINKRMIALEASLKSLLTENKSAVGKPYTGK